MFWRSLSVFVAVGLITLFTGCTTTSSDPDDYIWVEDYTSSSIAGTWVKYKLVRDGDMYRALNDPWVSRSQLHTDPFAVEKPGLKNPIPPSISVTELELFREAQLKAPRNAALLLEAYNISPESIAAQKEVILQEVLDDHWKSPGGTLPELPKEIEQLLSFENISPHLLSYAIGTLIISTGNHKFIMHLPGDPEVILEGSGFHAGLLPFTVSFGDETWKVYDPALFPILRKLLSPESRVYQNLVEAETWQKGGIPESLMLFYHAYLGGSHDQYFSRMYLEKLTSLKDALQIYELGGFHSGNFMPYGFSISVDLIPKKSEFIHDVRWYIPLGQPPPEEGWNYVINGLKQSEKILGQHKVVRD